MLPLLVAFSWSCFFVHSTPISDDVIQLEKLSTLYIPYKYVNSTPLYHYKEHAVEQSAYDPENKILYIVGGSIIHAIDIQNAANPEIIYYKQEENVDYTDIEFCRGDVFVSMHNLSVGQSGQVYVFNSLSSKRPMEIKRQFKVRTGPDMLTLTSDCKTILVAIEGEPYIHNGELIDPEGGIEIIKIIENDTSINVLNFSDFNTRWEKLEPRGLRFVYRGKGNTFSNDAEPEYITFNKDQTKAYISLQENNAVAVVDLQSETMEDILPLGFKSWDVSKMDASDKDDGINMRSWPVMGMYQPDAIRSFEWKGKGYLLTANEGDNKNYMDDNGNSEDTRINDIILSNSSSVLRWAENINLSSSVQDVDMLGRLKISKVMGKTADGSYDKLYAFGGRGFSIRNLENMELVYDSGSLIEELHSKHFPDFFNSNGGKASQTVPETFDSKSDDKGPECESVEVAYVGNRVLLFIGSERPGSVAIFTIDSDVTKPNFHSIWMGIEEKNGTWADLYKRRKISGLDPEDIRYLSPSVSPTGDHNLIVCGTVGGTITLFRIHGLEKAPNHLRGPSNSEMKNNYSTFLIFGILLLSVLSIYNQ